MNFNSDNLPLEPRRAGLLLSLPHLFDIHGWHLLAADLPALETGVLQNWMGNC